MDYYRKVIARQATIMMIVEITKQIMYATDNVRLAPQGVQLLVTMHRPTVAFVRIASRITRLAKGKTILHLCTF